MTSLYISSCLRGTSASLTKHATTSTTMYMAGLHAITITKPLLGTHALVQHAPSLLLCGPWPRSWPMVVTCLVWARYLQMGLCLSSYKSLQATEILSPYASVQVHAGSRMSKEVFFFLPFGHLE